MSVNLYKDGELTKIAGKGETPDISGKQDKTDNSLETTAKTVAGAINEVNNGKIDKNSNGALNTLTLGSVTYKPYLCGATNGDFEIITNIDGNAVVYWIGNTVIGESMSGAIMNREIKHTVLSATLVTGETSLTFTNDTITSDSLVEIYTNVWGVMPSAVSQSSGSLTLTFDVQTQDIGVKVEVH